MNSSLSIIVPVRNAEKWIVQRVEWLLDTLPDLTADFEVVIVDDGSTDNTDEVLQEIVQEFPQVQLVRHRQPQGQMAAVHTGLARVRCDVILVDKSSNGLSSSELQSLWQLRSDNGLIMARSSQEQQSAADSSRYFRRDESSRGTAVEMIRRESVSSTAPPPPKSKTATKNDDRRDVALHILARRRRNLRRRLKQIGIGG